MAIFGVKFYSAKRTSSGEEIYGVDTEGIVKHTKHVLIDPDKTLYERGRQLKIYSCTYKTCAHGLRSLNFACPTA